MTIDEAVERLKAIYKADPSSIDRMAIAKATNALKRSKWILCSKRTPDEDGRYLVTRGSGEDTYTTFLNWNKREGWYVDCLRPVDVVAWMELPDPYKEADHE